MQEDLPLQRHDDSHRTALKRTVGGVLIVLLLLVLLAIQPTIGAPAATAIFWSVTAVIVVVTRFRR